VRFFKISCFKKVKTSALMEKIIPRTVQDVQNR